MADRIKPLEAHYSVEPGEVFVGALIFSGNFRDAGNWCGRVGNVTAEI